MKIYDGMKLKPRICMEKKILTNTPFKKGGEGGRYIITLRRKTHRSTLQKRVL